MLRKRNLIRRARAFAVCVPRKGRAKSVGVEVGASRIDLGPSEAGIPSRSRFGAEAETDDFDDHAFAFGVSDDLVEG